MSNAAEWRPLIRWARARGWEMVTRKRAGSHRFLRRPGHEQITFSIESSDPRAIRNVRALVLRAERRANGQVAAATVARPSGGHERRP